ncbi:MAG: hypothetical protein V1934_00390 [Methanobacteriota archaeon]
MPLLLASHRMRTLLENLSDSLLSKCPSIEWNDSDQWRTFKTKQNGLVFVRIRPYKDSIAIFPHLPLSYMEQIESFKVFPVSGKKWEKKRPFRFNIVKQEQIQETIHILMDANYYTINGTLEHPP